MQTTTKQEIEMEQKKQKATKISKGKEKTESPYKNSTENSENDNKGNGKEETLAIPLQSTKDATLPPYRELEEKEKSYYQGLIEALLFVSTDPVSLGFLAKHCQLDRVNTRTLVDDLIDNYEELSRGIVLKEIASGYQLLTSEQYSNVMKNIHKEQKRGTLSRATLETLAVICYQQPITLPEIDEIRGTSSRTMLSNLLQKKLIKAQGNRPIPGHPTLYATTRDFLTHFALGSLNELPPLKEIKELEFDAI